MLCIPVLRDLVMTQLRLLPSHAEMVH
jgi:hypothetical protein